MQDSRSRAVGRDVESGSSSTCVHCGEEVRFSARQRVQQVICNVYDGARWLRVEHFHRDCYVAAGSPCGPPDDSQPRRRRNSQVSPPA